MGLLGRAKAKAGGVRWPEHTHLPPPPHCLLLLSLPAFFILLLSWLDFFTECCERSSQIF